MYVWFFLISSASCCCLKNIKTQFNQLNFFSILNSKTTTKFKIMDRLREKIAFLERRRDCHWIFWGVYLKIEGDYIGKDDVINRKLKKFSKEIWFNDIKYTVFLKRNGKLPNKGVQTVEILFISKKSLFLMMMTKFRDRRIYL